MGRGGEGLRGCLELHDKELGEVEGRKGVWEDQAGRGQEGKAWELALRAAGWRSTLHDECTLCWCFQRNLSKYSCDLISGWDSGGWILRWVCWAP